MTTFTQEQLLALKLNILGYKKELKPTENLSFYNQVESIIKNLKVPEAFNLPTITLEEVQTGAKTFYDEYFTLHNIPFLSINKLSENRENIMHSETGAISAQKYNSLMEMIDPFTLPITLVKGNSMIGEIQKPLVLCPEPGFKENIQTPFSTIELGDNLTALSTATYIHEISHSQTESIPGYAESYHLKEVISIFLEKLAILEQDSTGTLLRMSEQARFAYCNEVLQRLKNAPLLRKIGSYTSAQALEDSMYIKSTLLATKLFDNYQKARKPKEKQKILSGIQSVFDGQQTIEELLLKQGITIAQAKDTNLIKRHI